MYAVVHNQVAPLFHFVASQFPDAGTRLPRHEVFFMSDGFGVAVLRRRDLPRNRH